MAAALLAAISFFPVEAEAVSAEKAIVLDAATGRVLYAKQADSQGLIASTTKIMTALVVCEQTNVLDRMKIPSEAVGIEGSSMYLQEDEVLTIQELLYGLMLHSGNDAAVALAIYCGGTVEGFVQMMNDKAHLLGMNNTHFENPNGLDSPGHYSTARDLAVLTSYAMKNPIFSKTVSTRTVNISNRSLKNHNRLLWRVDGVDGVKTGYTKAAGRILVSTALRDGRRLIVVTMNDPNDWQDHERLLSDGFDQYKVEKIISRGDCLGYADVVGGEYDCVTLIASEDFSYSLAAGEEPKIVLQEFGMIYAPVVYGQQAGFAYICIGDTVAGKVNVTFGETIEQRKIENKSFWRKLFGGTEV